MGESSDACDISSLLSAADRLRAVRSACRQFILMHSFDRVATDLLGDREALQTMRITHASRMDDLAE
jgi:hypothetical protein